MSMSISYEAKRDFPMSETEEAVVSQITDKYYQEYAKDHEEYEGPYTRSDAEYNIYEGFLRMPIEDEAEEIDAFIKHWLKWLTEITRTLEQAEWDVAFEGIPLIWSDETGWRMMSDEEYEAFQ